jgi:nitroreductase
MKQEAIEVLMNRRSVRKFKPEQISDEALKAVLDAGTYAPTAKGEQRPWIVAVQDKETRDALAELNTKIAGRPADCYYGAPTLIFVLAPDDEFGPLDAAAVETNMLNAAYACGLGSCWIHRANKMFKTPEGKAYLRKWGLDENLDGWCSIALGYADMDPPPPKERKADYYRIIK